MSVVLIFFIDSYSSPQLSSLPHLPLQRAWKEVYLTFSPTLSFFVFFPKSTSSLTSIIILPLPDPFSKHAELVAKKLQPKSKLKLTEKRTNQSWIFSYTFL